MNVFQFPKKQQAPARPIPREEFERLAELALDVVDRIVAMLNEPSCHAGYEQASRIIAFRPDDQNGDQS